MKRRILRAALLVTLTLLLGLAAVLLSHADGHSLTVAGGTGGGTYEAGQAVTVRADAAPEGKVFCRWEADFGLLADAYAPETVFTMPAQDAVLTATYTDKTRVNITGLSVPGKTYDGAAAAVQGAPVSDAGEIPARDYLYAFTSTDGGGYNAAEPPKNAGAYRLTVTVADTNAGYFGTSGSIAFTISPATLTVTPDAGQSRYIGCENPAFLYASAGAAAGEVPAFTGALSGAADASAAAGDYAIAAGTLALTDSGAFLAKNYTLSVFDGASYAVAPYETAAVAAAAGTNLGLAGFYTGEVTLNAPDGFLIALSQTDANFAPFVTVPVPVGEQMQRYYLKVASGADQNAVTGTKYLWLKGDAVAPTITLYAPCAENAAASGGQKIIFAVSEPVTGVAGAGKKIRIEAGGTVYEADAGAGVPVGSPARGPWYLKYDLSHFKNAEGTALSLTANTAYTVRADAGALLDAAGNGNAAYDGGAFRTGDAGGKLVVYTLDGAAAVTDDAGTPVLSGQSVPAGTVLHFPTDFGDGTAVTWTVYEDGQAARDVDLSAYRLNADLEVYASIGSAALPGALTLSGAARYGETLTAVVTGADGLTLLYTWFSGEEAVQTGERDSYAVRGVDVGRTITVRVTCATRTGALEHTTAAVQKAEGPAEKPEKPTAASKTATSVTLTRVAGMEYRMRANGGTAGAWQDSTEFTGLASGVSYFFSCRVKETGVRLCSLESDEAEISTYGTLTGTVAVRGNPVYGATLTAELTGSNNEGALSWRWLRGETVVGRSESYVVTADDVGKTLTVEASSTAQSGSVSIVTALIGRAPYAGATPNAPTVAGFTAISVTLTAADGCEYSKDGQKWQTAAAFTGLTPGTAYTFYQRVRETDTHLCSPASAGTKQTTIAALTGTVYSTGEARYGKTVTAELRGDNNGGTLTYTWKRGTQTVGSGTSYAVQQLDIGNQLSVEVTSSVQYGSVTRIFGTVLKSEYVGYTPDAPTQLSRTSAKVTLTPLLGYEYSQGGASWQDSNIFSGLKAGTTYRFYQRVKATATMEASPASEPLSVKTLSGSSGGSGGGSGSDDEPEQDTETVTALYTLTLSSSNTRVSAATLKSLIKGNETQDVVIKLDNASYTFFKGTMHASAGKLWYDFGLTIDGCIHEQAASALAGDAYLSTIHYNFDGDLPAKANIKLWLGAKNAGKTVYYYRFDPTAKTLTYLQTAVVDVDGWVTVVQTSCSDYVFCDTEQGAGATVSPTPGMTLQTPEPSAEPAETPVSAPAKTSFSSWVLALMLIAALLLIIAGIWLWMRGRER